MIKRFISVFLVCVILLFCLCSCGKSERFSKTYIEYFDTASVIVGYEKDEEQFNEVCSYVEEQLKKYNKLYDIYKSYEDDYNIRTINKNAGKKPVKVDIRIIDLLEYCKDVYTMTNGKVNVAMGSVLSIWHDYRTWGIDDPSEAELPPMDKLRAAAEHTDINKVIIDRENSTVFLEDPEMSLDVGAVAKGYATEQIAQDLIDMEITGYTLNIGGNVRTIGVKGDGKPWTASVANPDTSADDAYIMRVELSDQVFVTSGSYQRFYTVDDVRYHHIIDPETLMPKNNFVAISILGNDSGLADALSTAAFNMSYEEGKKLIEKFDDFEAMWVTADNEILYTDGFEKIIIE